MPLPKAIQRAAEQADQMALQFAEADDSQLVVDPNTGLPLGSSPPVAEPTPPVQPAAPATTDDFEHKYRSIKGKYDAEVPVLRNQAQTFERINQSLSAQVANLTEQLAAAQRMQATAPAVRSEPVVSATAKDVETFGSDLIDLITRVSGAQTESAKSEIIRHLNDLRGAMVRTQGEVGEVKQNTAKTERALYEQRLTEAVPNWREVNATQEWLAWLAEFDPVLGSTRQAAVSDAYEKFDAPRTVAFLEAYARTVAARDASRPRTPQEELASQVQPRSTSAPAPTVPNADPRSAKVWTQTEIADFYRACIQGKFKAAPAEKERIEAEINAAVAEGRVR